MLKHLLNTQILYRPPFSGQLPIAHSTVDIAQIGKLWSITRERDSPRSQLYVGGHQNQTIVEIHVVSVIINIRKFVKTSKDTFQNLNIFTEGSKNNIRKRVSDWYVKSILRYGSECWIFLSHMNWGKQDFKWCCSTGKCWEYHGQSILWMRKI